MYEQPALFCPDGQHIRAGFSRPAFPYMGPGCRITPVSYTHLEVYKRQTLYWAGIPGGEGDFPSEESFLSLIHI